MGVVAQDLDVAALGAVAVLGDLDPVQLCRIDDHVGALELSELAQLGVGERRLRRAAAPEQNDVGDARHPKGVDRVIGGVGRRQLTRIEHEHARHIDRHVAVADDHRPATVEIEHVVGEIRMAVVPGDERRRRMRAGAILAGDPQPVVGRGPDRVHDDVIASQQVLA